MGNCGGHQPPGRASRDVPAEILMMVCTAGHVDHGKTALVRLLTGCETDRLKEEQERGLTIELGFAPCYLGEGIGIGIVDVPGHEKFIRNMVAGVSGIAMTILVVAADDGIKPQTVEHFRIMELLGVSHGVVALTKTDLAESARVEAVAADLRAFLKGTFLDGAPICPVSSVTFEGYPEFYEILVREAKKLARARSQGVFRMPVAQVFTRKGFGEVVMGIPVEGDIRVGETVEIVPGGRRGKIRAIEQFMRGLGDQGIGMQGPEHRDIRMALNDLLQSLTDAAEGDAKVLAAMRRDQNQATLKVLDPPQIIWQVQALVNH